MVNSRVVGLKLGFLHSILERGSVCGRVVESMEGDVLGKKE